MEVFTKVYISGPESRATLEANRTLGDDGGVTARSHQVMDLKKDLRDKNTWKSYSVTKSIVEFSQ